MLQANEHVWGSTLEMVPNESGKADNAVFAYESIPCSNTAT